MNTFDETSQQAGWGAGAQREGRVARAIEQRTARLPSDLFLWGAGVALIGSLALEITGFVRPQRMTRGMFGRRIETRAPLATFVGQWVPTLLLLGIYNKIVKVAGSDRMTR